MSNLPQISEAEFEVMKIVWKYAPISTNEITEKLTQISSWSPKTIQTLIKRLVSKKALTYEKQSRVFVYTPLVKEDDRVTVSGSSNYGKIHILHIHVYEWSIYFYIKLYSFCSFPLVQQKKIDNTTSHIVMNHGKLFFCTSEKLV